MYSPSSLTTFLENIWRFKDAGVVIGTAESTNPVFTFPSSGTYEVELVTVSNPYGYRDSVTKTVTVSSNSDTPTVVLKIKGVVKNVAPVKTSPENTSGASLIQN